MGRKKHTQSEIEDIFEKRGFTVLGPYKGALEKLNVICYNGHKISITVSSFKQGIGCADCSGYRKHTQEYVSEFLMKNGYLLNSLYKNNREKISTICSNGHKYCVTFNNFQKGVRCSDCSGTRKYTQEEVTKIFKLRDYVLVDEYKNNDTSVLVLCDKGHKWKTTLCNFIKGSNCAACNKRGVSKKEFQLSETLRDTYSSVTKLKDYTVNIQDKPYIHGFDIDIFIPELNIGIEFDGKYYHSFKGLKRAHPKWPDSSISIYHEIKDDYFMKKYNIAILHIKEEDWDKNKEECVEKCLYFIHMYDNAAKVS